MRLAAATTATATATAVTPSPAVEPHAAAKELLTGAARAIADATGTWFTTVRPWTSALADARQALELLGEGSPGGTVNAARALARTGIIKLEEGLSVPTDFRRHGHQLIESAGRDFSEAAGLLPGF